jgi:hypothetical protein
MNFILISIFNVISDLNFYWSCSMGGAGVGTTSPRGCSTEAPIRQRQRRADDYLWTVSGDALNVKNAL